MQAVTIDLLRHGAVTGPKCFRGETDDPLSDLGWRQMRHACPQQQGYQAIYSSPLKRCAAFAEELAATCGQSPLFETEISATRYGHWERRSAKDIATAEPEVWRAYQEDLFGFRPPGGESVVDVAQRARAALLRILAEHQAGSVLLVTHSNVILGILARVSAIPPSHWGSLLIGHGSFTRLRFTNTGNGWQGQLGMHLGMSPIR